MRRLSRTRKWKIAFGFVIGLSAAMGTMRWPGHARSIEMLLYTAIVFMALLFSFWPERRVRGFERGLGWSLIIHAITIAAIWRLFPFSTILIVLPIAFVEFVAMAIVMFRFIGEE